MGQDEKIPFENITGRETEEMPPLLTFQLYHPEAGFENDIEDIREMGQVEANFKNNLLRESGSDARWILYKEETI